MEQNILPSLTSSPKDVFVHILAIVTMYGSAISFLTLLFQYIELLIPDVLQCGYYARAGHLQTVRLSLASLIIIFPVFCFTNRFLNKCYTQEPILRTLRIRKWLLYFTLFIVALVIIGDLVTLIFHLLGGELTGRFLFKVFIVFFVAGSVFWYYGYDLKKYRTE